MQLSRVLDSDSVCTWLFISKLQNSKFMQECPFQFHTLLQMPTDSVSSSKPRHVFRDNFFGDKQDSAVTTSLRHIQLSQPSA